MYSADTPGLARSVRWTVVALAQGLLTLGRRRVVTPTRADVRKPQSPGARVLTAFLLMKTAFAGPEMIPLEVFEATKAAATARDAKGVSLPLRGGGTFELSEHAGSPVLLSFWASWCAPCRKELPALSRWAKQHPEVKVVAVGVDRDQASAERFIQSVAFDLPVAFDPDAANLGRFGVTSMPTMFLFDRQGALSWRHTGFSEDRGLTALDDALKDVR